jgi:Relaxase/Mobilisation nuclease domain
MTQQRIADNMLQEWGTRLFYGMPKKGKKTGDGKLLVGAAMAGSALLSAGTVRGFVRSAVRPHAKQVLVKISGGGKGMKAVAAHFRYIARQGKPEVGGRGQSLELEDERGQKISGADAIKDLQYDWRMAGSYIPDESHRKEAFNIVLSMPKGTTPELVLDSVRAFAKETFEGHKYVFVLHDDTDSPHVHLAVRAERNDGQRLNPRKADLQRWRERFAARLQDRGISAVATRASTRGVTTAPRRLWQARVGPDGRGRVDAPRARSAGSVEHSRRQALRAWEKIAKALVSSPEKSDQALALEVVRYVGEAFGVASPGRGRDQSLGRGRGEPSR